MISIANFTRLHLNSVATIFVIGLASIFFIYCGQSGKSDVIASYSLLTIYIFLLLHLLSFGLDQYIISDFSNIEHGKVKIGWAIFYPIGICLGILIFVAFISDGIKSEFYATVGLKYLYELNNALPATLIVITALFGVYAKIYVAILTKLMVCNAGNYFFVGKAIGFCIGLFLAMIFSLREWLILLPIFTELLPFVILLLRVKGRLKLFNTFRINPNYLFSGVNVFSFDAILKTDLILLSFSGSLQYLPVYAILSSVYEGFVQIFSSYRYKFAALVIQPVRGLIWREILVPCIWVTLMFSPAVLLFNLLTVNQFDANVVLSILILQCALFVGVFGIVTFHYLEIKGKPMMLTMISLKCLFLNVLLGSLFVDKLGIIGVSAASLLAYLLLSSLNCYFISRFSSKSFFYILKGRL